MKSVFHLHISLPESYNRRARIQPVIITLLPILILPFFFIDWQLNWVTVRWLILYFIGTTLLVQLGRGRGKAKEDELFNRWGGKPSVAMLRHCDTRLAVSDKERYKRFLSQNIPGLKLASPEEEAKFPDRADDGYTGATSWLLAKTRDRDQHSLIFEENVSYGFRRNLWALQAWAFFSESVSAICMVVHSLTFWTGEIFSTLQAMPEIIWIYMLMVLLHACAFAFVVRAEWVRVQAETYARQLLAACDTI